MSSTYNLDKAVLEEAVTELSMEGKWFYTSRNLYWELVRREHVPQPDGNPEKSIEKFEASLNAFEQQHGPLHKRVRTEMLAKHLNKTEINPDLLTYAVRRVIVFQRPELYLMFALNQFYMRLECLLVSGDEIPEHITSRVAWQIENGLPVDFFVVHDATAEGFSFAQQMWEKYGDRENISIQQSCLTFEHAKLSNVLLRETSLAKEDEQRIASLSGPFICEEDRKVLEGGGYTHLEQVQPLRMMRLVYNRTVNRFDEVGFG